MSESNRNVTLLRNLSVYTVGVAMAVAGALGIAAAIELSELIAWPLFLAGLALVLIVHEYFGGPV